MKAGAIEDCINEIERRVRAELPVMRKIFIEVDANGDGRGLAWARKAWAAKMAAEVAAFGPTDAGPKDKEAAE